MVENLDIHKKYALPQYSCLLPQIKKKKTLFQHVIQETTNVGYRISFIPCHMPAQVRLPLSFATKFLYGRAMPEEYKHQTCITFNNHIYSQLIISIKSLKIQSTEWWMC